MELPIEFNVEIPKLEDDYRQMIENTLLVLNKGHRDITGASMTISQPAHGETPYLYRVGLVVYMRPTNIYADEKNDTLEGAIKGVTEAITQQIRERREKLGEPWKRPDIPSEESDSSDED